MYSRTVPSDILRQVTEHNILSDILRITSKE